MTLTPRDLPSGTVMIGPIGGLVPGVFPVGLGEILLAPRKDQLDWKTWWMYRHAAIVDPDEKAVYIIQAMPSGAERVRLPDDHWTRDYVYILPDYLPGIGERVCTNARKFVDEKTPYNFLTYGALAAAEFHLPNALLRKWISTRHDMMCSQLVDQSQADAGWHNFDDGRLPQNVVPSELYLRLLEEPGQHMSPGDADWTRNGVGM